MALIFWGSTRCRLCERVLYQQDEVVAFAAFLPVGHPLHSYSDCAFHRRCFQEWPDGPEFERLYQRFQDVWASRPRNLTSLEEMEAWGEKAIKPLFTKDDPENQ